MFPPKITHPPRSLAQSRVDYRASTPPVTFLLLALPYGIRNMRRYTSWRMSGTSAALRTRASRKRRSCGPWLRWNRP